ncbi:MAG: radical SAM protein [Verrucomicrobia bacterium]|nr:radical SAM protein [Verrucomicrobiota bacterium]
MPDRSFIPTAAHIKATGQAQADLHSYAAETARARFGRRVFVRAVVEASNYCRQNCDYCGMRRDNGALSRFRATFEPLAELLIHQRPDSVTDVNIQTGEDPVAARDVVLPLVRMLRRETNLGISVCLGSLGPALYAQLHEAGATTYIMKFEMAGPGRYERFHAPGTLANRLRHIRLLADAGWNVSSGFIAGLPGQTTADLLTNLALAKTLPLAGCSVSPFIPGDETPLKDAPAADINQTLNCMAAMRLMRPDWVIPSVSALNLAQPVEGYRRGLRTGANLVTINLTPSEMRGNYLLYKRDRFIMTEERILHAIEAEGLTPSTESLADHLQSRRQPAPALPQAELASTSP